MKNIFLLALSLLTVQLFSQEEIDQRSQKILKDLSSKTKAYTHIKASFNSTLENKQANLSLKQEGKLILQGTKYVLNIDGEYDIINNGSTNWMVALEDEEVIIENAADLMEENNIEPSKIFTIWEDGFKHKYEKSESLSGIPTHVIKLFPKEAGSKSFHTIVLYIDQNKMEIKKVKVLGKSGDNYTYVISNFEGSTEKLDDSTFNFSKSKYADFDIIDNR